MANKKLIGDLNVAGTLSQNNVPLLSNLAADYDPTATYAAGDYCIHAGALYRCAEDISVAEAWDASHWEAAKVGTDLAAAGGVEAASILEIRRLFRTEYAITATVLHGSVSGDENIWTKETATVIIVPDARYVLPDSITVTGANYTYDNSTGVISLSSATGNVSIVASCPAQVVAGMPVKGDILTLDGGTEKYRVLKVAGTMVEVLAMYNTVSDTLNRTTTTFSDGSKGVKYDGNVADVYANSTFYDSLSTNIKNAIIPKNIKQSVYKISESQFSGYDFSIKWTYNGGSSTSYEWYQRLGQVSVGDRYCYLPDIDDIEEYLGVTQGLGKDFKNGDQLLQIFFGVNGLTLKSLWLASAVASLTSSMSRINTSSKWIDYSFTDYSSEIRPAFQIDLSQVTYTKE